MQNSLKKYEGVVAPMVSPLNEDYSIDSDAVGRILNSYIENKVIPFVLGTTGEVTSLSFGQKTNLVKIAAKHLDGRVPLVAGVVNNSILDCIEEGKRYADLGVEALVTIVPNYYPLDHKQSRYWFERLADELPLPMFLYNMPLTTQYSIPLDLVEHLIEHPNIIGIKDSEQNEERLGETLKRWGDREDFLVLVGSAALSSFGLKRGANGIVPSVANFAPGLYRELYKASKEGDFEKAEKFQQRTNIISSYVQSGRNVTEAIPALKAIMSIKELCKTYVMPPMMRMTDEQEYLKEMKTKVSNPLIEI